MGRTRKEERVREEREGDEGERERRRVERGRGKPIIDGDFFLFTCSIFMALTFSSKRLQLRSIIAKVTITITMHVRSNVEEDLMKILTKHGKYT